MKKRAIALSVAAALSAQSLAFAQSADRTANIGQNSIAEAKANLAEIKTSLTKLDKSLEDISAAIEKRDESGRIANIASVTGATIGLGLSAVSYFTLKSRHGEGGAGIIGMFATVIGMGSTVLISGGGGAISALQKKDVSTEQMSKDIGAMQVQVANELQGSHDKSTKGHLTQLQNSLSGLQGALAAYTKDETDTSRSILAAHIAQVAGTALTVYGLTQRNNSAAVKYGALLMSAGNIARVVEGISDSKAEEVQKEITQTRTTLRTAAASLE